MASTVPDLWRYLAALDDTNVFTEGGFVVPLTVCVSRGSMSQCLRTHADGVARRHDGQQLRQRLRDWMHETQMELDEAHIERALYMEHQAAASFRPGHIAPPSFRLQRHSCAAEYIGVPTGDVAASLTAAQSTVGRSTASFLGAHFLSRAHLIAWLHAVGGTTPLTMMRNGTSSRGDTLRLARSSPRSSPTTLRGPAMPPSVVQEHAAARNNTVAKALQMAAPPNVGALPPAETDTNGVLQAFYPSVDANSGVSDRPVDGSIGEDPRVDSPDGRWPASSRNCVIATSWVAECEAHTTPSTTTKDAESLSSSSRRRSTVTAATFTCMRCGCLVDERREMAQYLGEIAAGCWHAKLVENAWATMQNESRTLFERCATVEGPKRWCHVVDVDMDEMKQQQQQNTRAANGRRRPDEHPLRSSSSRCEFAAGDSDDGTTRQGKGAAPLAAIILDPTFRDRLRKAMAFLNRKLSSHFDRPVWHVAAVWKLCAPDAFRDVILGVRHHQQMADRNAAATGRHVASSPSSAIPPSSELALREPVLVLLYVRHVEFGYGDDGHREPMAAFRVPQSYRPANGRPQLSQRLANVGGVGVVDEEYVPLTEPPGMLSSVPLHAIPSASRFRDRGKLARIGALRRSDAVAHAGRPASALTTDNVANYRHSRSSTGHQRSPRGTMANELPADHDDPATTTTAMAEDVDQFIFAARDAETHFSVTSEHALFDLTPETWDAACQRMEEFCKGGPDTPRRPSSALVLVSDPESPDRVQQDAASPSVILEDVSFSNHTDHPMAAPKAGAMRRPAAVKGRPPSAPKPHERPPSSTPPTLLAKVENQHDNAIVASPTRETPSVVSTSAQRRARSASAPLHRPVQAVLTRSHVQRAMRETGAASVESVARTHPKSFAENLAVAASPTTTLDDRCDDGPTTPVLLRPPSALAGAQRARHLEALSRTRRLLASLDGDVDCGSVATDLASLGLSDKRHGAYLRDLRREALQNRTDRMPGGAARVARLLHPRAKPRCPVRTATELAAPPQLSRRVDSPQRALRSPPGETPTTKGTDRQPVPVAVVEANSFPHVYSLSATTEQRVEKRHPRAETALTPARFGFHDVGQSPLRAADEPSTSSPIEEASTAAAVHFRYRRDDANDIRGRLSMALRSSTQTGLVTLRDAVDTVAALRDEWVRAVAVATTRRLRAGARRMGSKGGGATDKLKGGMPDPKILAFFSSAKRDADERCAVAVRVLEWLQGLCYQLDRAAFVQSTTKMIGDEAPNGALSPRRDRREAPESLYYVFGTPLSPDSHTGPRAEALFDNSQSTFASLVSAAVKSVLIESGAAQRLFPDDDDMDPDARTALQACLRASLRDFDLRTLERDGARSTLPVDTVAALTLLTDADTALDATAASTAAVTTEVKGQPSYTSAGAASRTEMAAAWRTHRPNGRDGGGRLVPLADADEDYAPFVVAVRSGAMAATASSGRRAAPHIAVIDANDGGRMPVAEANGGDRDNSSSRTKARLYSAATLRESVVCIHGSRVPLAAQVELRCVAWACRDLFPELEASLTACVPLEAEL